MSNTISIFYFLPGMDIPNLHYVVHFGIPASLDDYMQETGRVGRDGLPSHAILLHHKDSIKGPHITAEAKSFSTTDQCLRQHLMDYFQDSYDVLIPPRCCSNCEAKKQCCPCSSKCSHLFGAMSCMCVKWCHGSSYFRPVIESKTDTSTVKQTVRLEMSHEDMVKCREKMTQLSLTAQFPVFPGAVCNEVYPQLLDNIFKNYRCIARPNDISNLGAYSQTTATELFNILNEFAPVCDFNTNVDASSDYHTTLCFSDSDD